MKSFTFCIVCGRQFENDPKRENLKSHLLKVHQTRLEDLDNGIRPDPYDPRSNTIRIL